MSKPQLWLLSLAILVFAPNAGAFAQVRIAAGAQNETGCRSPQTGYQDHNVNGRVIRDTYVCVYDPPGSNTTRWRFVRSDDLG